MLSGKPPTPDRRSPAGCRSPSRAAHGRSGRRRPFPGRSLRHPRPPMPLSVNQARRAVVGRFDRFQNGKQLSRYCGLTPCNASSGKRQADAGLVPAGHQDLRAALIALAKRLPRHVPRWKEFKDQLGRRKSANVVSAAIANRWLRRVYHELKAVKPADGPTPGVAAA